MENGFLKLRPTILFRITLNLTIKSFSYQSKTTYVLPIAVHPLKLNKCHIELNTIQEG
uniref:Uncharacterized protein n=1 Tax=Octopus bimaculoides TaxID=37653 RepID=A0A0L8I3S5_OCTBM